MHASIYNAAAIVVALAVSAVSARTQGGLCGQNGFDGINSPVPACAFEAGSTADGTNFQYSLPIKGISSCSECTTNQIYGIYECTLSDCNEAYPYEPCASATC